MDDPWSLTLTRSLKLPLHAALPGPELEAGQSGETETAPGGVAERSKALVLKTREVRASQGSNPCPSAKIMV